MTAIAEVVQSSQGALPVCPSWGNPRGLVTLWDLMKQYEAHLFAEFSFLTGQLHQLTKTANADNGPSPAAVDAFRQSIGSIVPTCRSLGLNLTVRQMLRAEQLLVMAVTDAIANSSAEGWPHANRSIFDIQKRLEDELQAISFFAIPSGLVEYFGQTLFGESVDNRFPSTSFDIKESGRCIALGRYTAAVFHLMRVLEVGLHSLARALGVTVVAENWGRLLRDIEMRVKGMESDQSWTVRSGWREKRESFAQAAAQFSVFRDAWRNHVSHTRANYNYTEEQAVDVFGAVRAFMQALAVQLEDSE